MGRGSIPSFAGGKEEKWDPDGCFANHFLCLMNLRLMFRITCFTPQYHQEEINGLRRIQAFSQD
jgi:hypothetical protein